MSSCTFFVFDKIGFKTIDKISDFFTIFQKFLVYIKSNSLFIDIPDVINHLLVMVHVQDGQLIKEGDLFDCSERVANCLWYISYHYYNINQPSYFFFNQSRKDEKGSLSRLLGNIIIMIRTGFKVFRGFCQYKYVRDIANFMKIQVNIELK